MKNIWYVSAGLLFLGAVSMPLGYYELLRWVICASAAFATYINYSIDKWNELYGTN
tara:strand:- start:436 stop:603 length:168 start_codon:yes stop_codon:yes gene_type:complete